MINVKFFGMLRSILKLSQLTIEASTVKTLIDNIEKKTQITCKKELRQAVIFINEVNFLKLKKYSTKLSPGDTVAFLSPASGG